MHINLDFRETVPISSLFLWTILRFCPPEFEVFKPVSLQDEQKFQRDEIHRQWQSYLGTDVLAKYREDEGYRKKVDMMDRALRSAGVSEEWIVDIGAGTCGEDECLSAAGFKIVCTDVNDVGLSVSQQRSKAFGRDNLKYVVCDGQKLPFADGTVAAVIFNESLHHMPDASRSLEEVSRILMPGGTVCMLEPCAHDPWRRISELRDYFRGTIEKSFSVSQLNALLLNVGLEASKVERPIYLSQAKLKKLSPVHRKARIAYYALRATVPSWLGMIFMTARKPGLRPDAKPLPFDELIRCPASGASLMRQHGKLVTVGQAPPKAYGLLNESIPILIENDSVRTTSVLRSGVRA